MTAYSIRDREAEAITYLRNTVVDPNGRGTQATQTFNGNGSTLAFTLTNTQVKQIVSVSIGGLTRYIGYDFTVAYGEGTAQTVVTFRIAPVSGTNNVSITYRYGTSLIYEGQQRVDSVLPRIAVMFMGAHEEMVSIGEDLDGTGSHWVYVYANFTAEIRSSFAKQMKDMLHDFANAINKFRQSTPQAYLTVMARVTSLQSFDFDNDLRIYRGQVSYEIQWMHKFD